MLFLTSDELNQNDYMGSLIRCMSSCLGQVPVNIDQDFSEIQIFKQECNSMMYEYYKNKYLIKSGVDCKSIWETFHDLLKKGDGS